MTSYGGAATVFASRVAGRSAAKGASVDKVRVAYPSPACATNLAFAAAFGSHPPRMTRLRARDETWVRPDGVGDDAVVTVFRVPPELAGMRLDQFLKLELHRTSRTRAQFIIRNSAYDDDGRKLRPNARVQAEQRVLLWRPAWDEQPVPTELPVLYEDRWLLVIDKPSGVPVHPTARYHKNTVVKLLEAARPDEEVFLAHRLDRETSGVLFLTKTSEADRKIKRMFEGRDVEKRYLALTWGVPGEPEFRVDLPLELDPTSSTRVKMRVAAPGEGLPSGTRFRVLGARAGYAQVACDLETGRQHQIRVHLAALGTPIVGDKLYAFDEGYFKRDRDGEGTEEDAAKLELPRHALHAHELRLAHPITGEPLTVTAPLPRDLATFWDARAVSG